ncbi:Hypothetical protein FKW44_020047, partial [Caligus rogercresseyi]
MKFLRTTVLLVRINLTFYKRPLKLQLKKSLRKNKWKELDELVISRGKSSLMPVIFQG